MCAVPEEEGKAEVTRGLLAAISRRRHKLAARLSLRRVVATPSKRSSTEQAQQEGSRDSEGRPRHVVVPFTPITLVCRDIRWVGGGAGCLWLVCLFLLHLR